MKQVRAIDSLLPSAFGSRLRLLHPFPHFGFHGLQVKACAALHRPEIKEGLEFHAHYLLDKHKAPELKLEPIEVLLSALFRSVVGPALALEWIEAQVRDV